MSAIRVLPENVSNKIAAGEVIERPASVLKELVENAIDAGATTIAVRVEAAGRRLIAVTDDGSGMDADDALLCLEPHATSKIRTEEDIHRILTMGFRGEAVPSIASVSRFRLRTRTRDAAEGREVLVEGGTLLADNPIGCAPGTEVQVRDLFFNVPARKKFLKADATEEKHLRETFCLLALANSEIAFESRMDDGPAFRSPACPDLRPRLGALLGKEIADFAIPVTFSDGGVRISGFISRPGFARNNRRDQRIFINRRPIRANVAYQAIREAYGTSVMKGAFPAVTLFIEMPPEEIDINVHPAKQEARFQNERKLAAALETALRNALARAASPAAAVRLSAAPFQSLVRAAEVSYAPGGVPRETPRQGQFDFQESAAEAPAATGANVLEGLDEIPPPSRFDTALFSGPFSAAESVENVPRRKENASGKELSLPGSGALTVLGVLRDSYILASCEMGLLIIDQHAAHERILFEKLLAVRDAKDLAQRLLVPVTLNLPRAETEFLLKNRGVFEDIGFSLEPFGEDTVLVTGVPPGVPLDNVSGLISDMVDALARERESRRGVPDRDTAAAAACSLAVKAGDPLATGAVEGLIATLAACEFPFTCPHGRPTVINISFQELEKRFGRKP